MKMDARSFGDFLVDKLGELAKTVEQNLLNSAYEKIEHSHRAAGTRDVLTEIVSKMPNLLEDFFKDKTGDSN
jgi:hypothetical protein